MNIQEVLTQLDTIIKGLAIVVGELTAMSECREQQQGESKTALTVKESKDMLTIKDCSIRVKGNSYEVRFQKFGYSKSFCNKKLEDAKARMRKWLKEISKELNKTTKKGHPFEEWLKIYLNSYKKLTLKENSFKNVCSVVNYNVVPAFMGRDIASIKTLELQDFLANLINQGKGRTAEECKTFLNGFFRTAKDNGLVTVNPMEAVIVPKHYRKHGTALTLEEERKFINVIKGDHYEQLFLFLLYSGARVSEASLFTLNDVDLNSNTITIHTTKVRDNVNGADRTVPIFPKLKKVIDYVIRQGKAVPFKEMCDHSNVRFKKLCSMHHLHELRHTFTTRCRECGIDNELTSLWTGHTFAGNTTSAVYTHFSMQFQQEQAKKLDY